ncbi:MAG TPA: cupredoxin family copper-binding protein [Devosia sp.]|nr:cupredoxin family copper-binding protein [Devosia sp.]
MFSLKTIAAAAVLILGAAAPALAANHAVTIKGMKFWPANITIAAGDTITFTNQDSAPHNATAADGSFATPRLSKGQSARVTVAAGTHSYICTIHPMMKGKVTAK